MHRPHRYLLPFFLAIPALAQFESADVLGTVRDASGSPVLKAAITLVNQGTALTSKTTTDDTGSYTFPNVKVGIYTVTAGAEGFSKAVAADIRVEVGARQRVDLTLQIGQITDSVNVTDAAATLETDSSEKGQVINNRTIVELPLNGRNYSDLALLSTNVHKSPISASFAANGTPREGSFNANGMRSTYNNFLLDGLDNNAYSPSNQGFSNQVVQPSPDAIAEFKVITTNFSAEYGRVGGAVVNAALRSGGNSIHFTAYEFLRNTKLNAVGFLFSPAVFQKPTLQRNQYGFNLGGPIVKNKLFFFGDYEGYRQLQRFLNFDSIPTLNDRNGLIVNPANGQGVTVYNALTNTLYPAGTAIPVSTINPFAARVLGALPNPNGPNRSNNLQALLLARDYNDKYDAKLDYKFSDKISTLLRFSQRKGVQYYEPDISGPSGGGGNGFIHATQQQAAAGLNWTVSPTSFLDARFGFNHILAGKAPPYLGGASLLDSYGIGGLPTSKNLTGGLNTQSVGGFNAFGRQATNPQYQNPTSFNPKLNYSRVMGRHTMKAGYEFLAVRTLVLDVNPLYGSNTYSGQLSKPTCTQLGLAAGCAIPGDTTSFNLADFMFGTPSAIALGTNFVTNQRQHVHSLYFQDDYRVNSKLTLNLGLRWDFATPLWERDNNWTNFDPATQTMVRAKSGSLYDRALVHPDYKDFGPRIGAAYSLNNKTVVRAGFGISYSFFNRVGSALENINSPLAIFGNFSQSFPNGGPVPSTFLTTQKAFSTNIADPSAFNPATSNVVYVDPDTKWPYIQSWLFSVQRELTRNTVLEVAYNGNHSVHLPIVADYNQALPNALGGTLGVQARRPIPGYGAITWVDPAGSNNYNGLSIRVEHKYTNGLYLLNSFTWSKALGTSEQSLETYPGYTLANPQNIRNLAGERGPTSFDVKFINVSSVLYQLPFGKGRKFGSAMSPVFDALFGGWESNVINTLNTGTPVNVNYGPVAANDGSGAISDFRGLAVLRPNFSGAGIDQSKSQLINTYFAGYTFTTPPANAPYGNLSRNYFRTPGLWQLDFAVNKTFKIRELARLQFRSEFFNLPNRTNFGPPTAATTSAAFGTIRTTYPARQIQFGLKLIY